MSIRGEDTGGEVFSASPMHGEQLGFGSPGTDDQQGAEMLGVKGLRVERTIKNNLWPHPPSVCRIGHQGGWSAATLDRIFDESAMPIRRGGVDEISHPGPRRKRNERRGERGMPIRMDQHSPRGHASLAGIHRHGRPDAASGNDWICIVQDDRGITAGKFKRGGKQSSSR
jgi:hypothetical protein